MNSREGDLNELQKKLEQAVLGGRVAEARNLVERMTTIIRDMAINPHRPTAHCGFDRNSSISNDRYVCNCGWMESL